MGVKDALTCALARIKDGSVSRKPFRLCQLRSYTKDSRDGLRMLLREFINIFAMRSRNDQDVCRRLWCEISESYNVIVAMEKFSRDLATSNLAEDTHDEMLALLPMAHQRLNGGESGKASMCRAKNRVT